MGSVTAAPRLYGTGLLVVAHTGLVVPRPHGIFSDQESNLCPGLAGRFFTTESPGKPSNFVFKINI